MKLNFYKFKVQKVSIYFTSVRCNYNEILHLFVIIANELYIFKKPRFGLIAFDRKWIFYIIGNNIRSFESSVEFFWANLRVRDASVFSFYREYITAPSEAE